MAKSLGKKTPVGEDGLKEAGGGNNAEGKRADRRTNGGKSLQDGDGDELGEQGELEGDLNSDDEVDFAGESESDGMSGEGEELESEENSDEASEGQSSDEDEEEDEEHIAKKRKKFKSDGSESFSKAFNAIIGSHIKAHDRKDPIMARNKVTVKKLESEKLEAKARRLLLMEKKQIQDKHRVKNLLPTADKPEQVREIIDRERRLKKVAQKGVVRLFNAVLSTQVRTKQEIAKEAGIGETKKEELINEISKEKFLDLVQAAGK